MGLPKTGKITPLWIIGGFLSITEAVALCVVPSVSDSIQWTLTVFVFLFPILVASAFFVILWNKPYVFYPPSEYPDADPHKFVKAMRSGVPGFVIQQIKEVESRPEDMDAQFALIDSLIEVTFRQHLICMYEESVGMPYNFNPSLYQTGSRGGTWAKGVFSPRDFCDKLSGTDLVKLNVEGPRVELTDKGRGFAQWLIDNDRKADFYTSHLGSWGTPFSPGGAPHPEATIEHPGRGDEDAENSTGGDFLGSEGDFLGSERR